jgi:ribosomal peptide maturation radical SAM protein 1
MRVLLANLPFGALNRPALGLSMLKPIVRSTGATCEVRYLNVTFAEFTGLETYERIQSGFPHTAFAGEWVFAEALNGKSVERDRGYIAEILREQWQIDDGAIRPLLKARRLAEPFLQHCVERIDWRAFDVVGFTSTFEQNLASLALARRLKARWPNLRTVFGGANWEGAMGEELHRTHSFVDLVCSGEAEESFPRLLQALAGGGEPALFDIPGIVFRGAGGETITTGRTPLVRDLDRYPPPDFSDFRQALDRSSETSAVVPTWLLETSRGCWWGAKSHCTFCGLNGGSMAFRSKSAARALEDIDRLMSEHDAMFIEVVDNILDMAYFRDLLPALAARGAPVQLFYEIKANLSKQQVRALADAGVRRVQPGIESLSDRLLVHIRKGTTGLRNIQLLKWCRQYGIAVDWNLLYGFPGETREDYDRILELLPAIRFLPPPCACGPLRLDRFSPYFADPKSFGLRDLRPASAYRYLYDVAAASLARIAYYFDFDYEDSKDPRDASAEVRAYVDGWTAAPEAGAVFAVPSGDGGLRLIDTRTDASMPMVDLEPCEAAAYAFCDRIQTASGVRRHLREAFGGSEFEPSAVEACLGSFVDNRLMVSDGKHYLALALDPPDDYFAFSRLAQNREGVRQDVERPGRCGHRDGDSHSREWPAAAAERADHSV